LDAKRVPPEECYRDRIVPLAVGTIAAQQANNFRDHSNLQQERTSIMNTDQIKGSWKQLKGKIKEKWGKLTDDDLTVIAGERDQLLGKLQERYGYTKEQAEKELARQQSTW
jgi:uncharacterized protein YjbJ (UPF0337 family)